MPVELSNRFPSVPLAAQVADRHFFSDWPDRKLRIRPPFDGEFDPEFQMLGMHEPSRRRIIVAKLPRDVRRQTGLDYMRVPLLQRADETIEDRDDIIGPILDALMREASGLPSSTDWFLSPSSMH